MTAWLEHGDMRLILPRLIADDVEVHAVVTDPPYELGFMGKKWDATGVAFQPETWRHCYDILPPGGHLLAFCGTRTYHRMTCAIEDAGFEIRDAVAWIYGSGFPKSKNIGNGWGTALKPAMELICVARKPLVGTVAGNVLAHGTGALNIDGCRIEGPVEADRLSAIGSGQGRATANINGSAFGHGLGGVKSAPHELGRWPANVTHDGSEEVVKLFPETISGALTPAHTDRGKNSGTFGAYEGRQITQNFGGDSGSAARFFYCPKAGKQDRMGFDHPTVKPIKLLRWLVRLVTPPGGVVLDPFAGTGTMGAACEAEGFDCIMIEQEPKYAGFIRQRLPQAQVTTWSAA